MIATIVDRSSQEFAHVESMVLSWHCSAQSYGIGDGKRRDMAWTAFIFLLNPTALISRR